MYRKNNVRVIKSLRSKVPGCKHVLYDNYKLHTYQRVLDSRAVDARYTMNSLTLFTVCNYHKALFTSGYIKPATHYTSDIYFLQYRVSYRRILI
jgi:hypothetical protein